MKQGHRQNNNNNNNKKDTHKYTNKNRNTRQQHVGDSHGYLFKSEKVKKEKKKRTEMDDGISMNQRFENSWTLSWL